MGGQSEGFDTLHVLMCASRLWYVVWFAGRVMWRGQIVCWVTVGDGGCAKGYRDILCVSCGCILIVRYGECVLFFIFLCLSIFTLKGEGAVYLEGVSRGWGGCTPHSLR